MCVLLWDSKSFNSPPLRGLRVNNIFFCSFLFGGTVRRRIMVICCTWFWTFSSEANLVPHTCPNCVMHIWYKRKTWLCKFLQESIRDIKSKVRLLTLLQLLHEPISSLNHRDIDLSTQAQSFMLVFVLNLQKKNKSGKRKCLMLFISNFLKLFI